MFIASENVNQCHCGLYIHTHKCDILALHFGQALHQSSSSCGVVSDNV